MRVMGPPGSLMVRRRVPVPSGALDVTSRSARISYIMVVFLSVGCVVVDQSGLIRTAHWGKPGSTPYSPSIPKLIWAWVNDFVVSNSMPFGSLVGIQRSGRGPVGRDMIASTLFSVPGTGL